MCFFVLLSNFLLQHLVETEPKKKESNPKVQFLSKLNFISPEAECKFNYTNKPYTQPVGLGSPAILQAPLPGPDGKSS